MGIFVGKGLREEGLYEIYLRDRARLSAARNEAAEAVDAFPSLDVSALLPLSYFERFQGFYDVNTDDNASEAPNG